MSVGKVSRNFHIYKSSVVFWGGNSRVEWLRQKPWPTNPKYVLAGPLQKKFANP